MVRVRSLVSLVLVGIVSASVAACGDDDVAPATSTNPTEPASSTTEVTVRDDGFEPANVTIAPGHTVKWNYAGSANRSVTSGTGSSDPGVGASFDQELSGSNPSFETKFIATGIFPYFSKDGTATGTITVE